MKKAVHFLLTIALATGLAWALRLGLRHQQADQAESAHAAPAEAKEESAPEEFTVHLSKERAQALALATGEPVKTELQPRRMGFGRVLDPTPLATLDGELAAAEAALSASRAEYERSQKLLAAGENTSRKIAEAAEAQFRADEIKASSMRRTALLNWGPAIADLSPQLRRDFVEKLVRAEAALVRVDILPGDAMLESPTRARIAILGHEDQPLDTAVITPAADVDLKTQAQGFLLRFEQPAFPLRPGMALTAWLELPGNPVAGFAVPRSAILRHDGQAWIYLRSEEEKFTRKAIRLDTPLEGERGWFVSSEGGVKAGDSVVVTGAQALLSEELKGQGAGDSE